jgi:hypothetical protein
MARVTHVKSAQQRYETVPVIDPETGEQKKTPIMKNGEQKKTKTGRLVFMSVTVEDRNKPKPLETCDFCKKDIEVGTPYKHVTPKSGPYGGRKRSRHESCPTWQQWDLSNSMAAQLARIAHDFWNAVDVAESADDVTSALDDAASSVDEIAEQKKEAAQNMEDGFGHPTEKSEELESIGDELESWAEEIRSADVPDMSECDSCEDGKADCSVCEGTGEVVDEVGDKPCDECSGEGQIDCDECGGSGEDIDAWRDQLRDELTIVDESSV